MTADFEPLKVDLAHEADFRLGEITVRPATRQIEGGGVSETLEPRIMQVLVVLARRRGHVVSRDDLIAACWEGRVVGDDALNRCISKIRKLGETHGAFRLETIPRVGYRLWAEEPAPAGEPAVTASSADRAPEARKPPAWPRLAVLVGGLLLIMLSVSIWLGVQNSKTVEIRPAMALAVLPFDAPDGDPETRTLADAIAPAIANKLTISGQSVVPQSQSAQFSGSRKAEAAKALNAQFLVDGSVVRTGDVAHIFVRVDHAARGVTMWSTTIDADASEPLLIADRLSALVTRTISWRGAVEALNSQAPDAVEQARALLLVIQRSEEYGDDRGAMAMAMRFREAAPKSSSAHRMVAIETIDALPVLTPAERMEALRQARASVLEAEKLEPGLFGAAAARLAATPAYAWGARIAGFESNTVDGIAPRFLAESYLRVGRVKAALGAAEQAKADDPHSKSTMRVRALTFLALNEKGLADAAVTEALLTWPNNPYFPELRFHSEAWLGRYDEAKALLNSSSVWQPADAQRKLMLNFLEARRHPDAKNIQAVRFACDLRRSARDEKTLTFCFSAMASINQHADAFAIAKSLFPDIRPQPGEDPDARWLSAPAAAWDPVVLYMPWTAPLRADGRIIPIFERLGLLDYWRDTGNWPDFCKPDAEPASASVCAQMMSGQPGEFIQHERGDGGI